MGLLPEIVIKLPVTRGCAQGCAPASTTAMAEGEKATLTGVVTRWYVTPYSDGLANDTLVA
jgi:hypothetical protein